MEVEAEARITPIGEAELQNRDAKKRLLLLIMAPVGGVCPDACRRGVVGILGTPHS